jgi:hypothetical protein
LFGALEGGGHVLISVDNGKLSFDFENTKEAVTP